MVIIKIEKVAITHLAMEIHFQITDHVVAVEKTVWHTHARTHAHTHAHGANYNLPPASRAGEKK